jgi:hypothetical protein
LSGVTNCTSISSIEASTHDPKSRRRQEHGCGLPGCKLKRAFTLFASLRPDQVIADRDPPGVTEQDQAHALDELALGRAVAEARVPGESAVGGAAWVVGAADQGAVDQADVALGD